MTLSKKKKNYINIMRMRFFLIATKEFVNGYDCYGLI